MNISEESKQEIDRMNNTPPKTSCVSCSTDICEVEVSDNCSHKACIKCMNSKIIEPII